MPEVSVVIPTHNRAAFVADAVDSALRQTWRDREVIVVDDGSTDDTLERLNRFRDRIRVIRKDQGGAASARNRGVAEAQGNWIAFLDSDDIWIDMKTEIQMDLARLHPEYGWMASSYWKLEGGREFRRTRRGRSGHVFRQIWEENFVRTSTVMIRKDALEQVGPFREDLAINEELDLWLRLAQRYAIGYIPDALALYRHHPGGVSRDSLKSREIYLDLIRQHDDPDRIPRWARRRREAYLLASIGKHRMRAGDAAGARRDLWKAVRTWPAGMKGWNYLIGALLRSPGRRGMEGAEAYPPRRADLSVEARAGDAATVGRWVDRYQAALEQGGIRILREGHRTRVARIAEGGVEVVIKHYRRRGPLDSLRASIASSRALAASLKADALERRGFGVPHVIGVAERSWRGIPYDSILIMEPIRDSIEMDRAISRLDPRRDGRSLRGLTDAFGERLRRMHEEGLFHGDLKSCNVLVRGPSPRWEFTFLDLEDVRSMDRVPVRLRLENLAQINATVPAWISRSDRLRFFLTVMGKKRLDEEGKNHFGKVWRRSQEKDRVFYDEEGVVREKWGRSPFPPTDRGQAHPSQSGT